MKFRSTRSAGESRPSAGMVVFFTSPGARQRPSLRISRPTRSLPQETPSRCSWRHIFSDPIDVEVLLVDPDDLGPSSASDTCRRDGGRVLLS